MTTNTETKQPAEPQPLTAAQRETLDCFCRRFQAADESFDKAEKEYDDAKAELLNFVDQHGYMPTNAEKSKRVEGAEFVATRTVGSTLGIHDPQVVKLQLALSRAKRAKLFPMLFESRTVYGLLPGATNAIDAAKLPARLFNRIMELFARCFDVKAKTPSLKVETLAEVAERNAKAAKKAAKKASVK